MHEDLLQTSSQLAASLMELTKVMHFNEQPT
jgi:hypothetical protein